MQKAHLKTTGPPPSPHLDFCLERGDNFLALCNRMFLRLVHSYRFKCAYVAVVRDSRGLRYLSLRFLVRFGQVPEKTLEFVRVEIISTWTRPQRNAGGGHLRIARARARFLFSFFFIFTCKSVVAAVKSGTDCGLSVCMSDKSVLTMFTRMWTHHDHTASEIT